MTDPAAIAGLAAPTLALGFMGVEQDFEDFPDLWWDTNQDGLVDATDTPLDAGPDYDPIQGFLLGATFPLWKQAAIGVSMFLPVQRLLRLETFEPSVPTYFLYANRTQRYELGVAAAWRPIWGIALGAGVQMIPRARYHLDATLDLTLSGAGQGDEAADDVVGGSLDVHSMSLDLVAGYAPIAAIQWDAGRAVPALDGLLLAAAWRGEAGLPVDVDVDLQINAGTADLGDLEDTVLPFVVGMQLGVFDHYVPEKLSFGASYAIAHTLTLSADLHRTAWDRMALSIASVTHVTLVGAGVELDEDDIADGNPYTVVLRPTWAPRVGADLVLPPLHLSQKLGDLRLSTRGGVGYEPTPLVSQTAATALLDADRFIFALGLGAEMPDPFCHRDRAHKTRLDAFFQYHVLASGQLDRGAPEVPTAGYSVDGSPIPIGGHLLAAGAEWSLEY